MLATLLINLVAMVGIGVLAGFTIQWWGWPAAGGWFGVYMTYKLVIKA